MLPRRSLLAAAGLGLAPAARAQAEPWPSRPVRMVIPWPPGGGNDIVGRLVSDRLAKALGQTVVVENRGGSNGVLGAEIVAKARADGYTLMFHSVTSHVVNPAVFPRLPYDTMRDFIPAAILGYSTLAIIVSPKLGVASLAELVAKVRAAPGHYNYGSFGNGSAAHLAGELFKQRLGLDMQHVPYRGGGPSVTDTINGALTMCFAGVNTAAAAIRAGLVLPLATTGARRSTMLPEVATVTELLGLADYDMGVHYAVWAPAGTPAAIVERVARECTLIMHDQSTSGPLFENGVEPMPAMNATERAERVARDARILGQVAREARLSLD